MPLDILLPMVVVGIAVIVLLIRVLRPTPPFRMRDRDDAIAIWNRHNPDDPARSVLLGPDRASALIETARGRGIIWGLGADPVTRHLRRDAECRETDRGLIIKSGDFTAPAIRLYLPSQRDRDMWRAMLEEKS